MRNYLTFGGKDLRDFGVYISGQGTFSAPARAYNVQAIAGRNGDIITNEKRLENIQVSYKAFIYTNFDANIRDLRNYLLSCIGYQKLTDSYHTDEYRMALWDSSFDPEVTSKNDAGEFTLTFNCKPQRFLDSGEEVTTMTASSPPTETYSGSIASFETDSALPMQIDAAIVPQQDLHGYDNPWPAGGGKNKFLADFENQTINGTAVALQSDGKVTTTGKPNSPFNFVIGHFVIPAGTYILNGCPSGGGSTTYRLQVTDYPVVNNLGQDAGSGVQFTIASDMEIAVRLQMYTGAPTSATFTPMIRLATETDATYAPYSNICPISGWAEVNVTRTGSNIWGGEQFADDLVATANDSSKSQKGEDENGKYVTWSAASSIPIVADLKFKENTQYTIILKGSKNNTDKNTNLVVVYSDGTFSYLQFPEPVVGNEITMCVYLTISTKTVVGFSRSWASGTTKFYYEDCGVFEGNLTASDFVPYQGNTYTIPLGSTIYGGTLTINEDGSGELTVDRAKKVFDGSTSDGIGAYNPLTGFWFALTGMSANYSAEGLCNMAKTRTSYGTGGVIFGISNNSYAYFTGLQTISGCTTVNELLPWLENNNVEFTYPLATPTTTTLTAQQINTLVGENNVWADSGDIEVTVTFPFTIDNPTLFPAQPLLRVYGDGILGVNSQSITITGSDVYTDIDCEMMDAYKGTANKNHTITLSDYNFPVLRAGVNNFVLGAGITKVEITPRWWRV